MFNRSPTAAAEPGWVFTRVPGTPTGHLRGVKVEPVPLVDSKWARERERASCIISIRLLTLYNSVQYVTARLLTLYNNILSDYYIYHRPKFLLSVHNTYNTYKVTLIKSGYMGVWGVWFSSWSHTAQRGPMKALRNNLWVIPCQTSKSWKYLHVIPQNQLISLI